MPANNDSTHMEFNPKENSTEPDGISRREMVRRLFLGVTATWATGGSHPVWAHLLNGSHSFPDVDANLADADWKPLFLTPDQYDVLRSLSEVIIPGSQKAYVSRFIDLLLSVETSAHQKEFIASLSIIQAEAVHQFGNMFQKLSASQHTSLLSSFSTSAKNGSDRESFENLKMWVVGSYYSSEIGMKELGWTPNRFFHSFPRCTWPEEHL